MSIVDVPWIRFGREVCGDFRRATRREWLVTNGLGGYASGTVAGVNSRRYHGLLVAALNPPVRRTVLVNSTIETVVLDGEEYPLSTHVFGDGTVAPDGYHNLESFHLEGTLPVWRYAFGDTLIERRLWMDHGENTTRLQFRLLRGSRDADLRVTPLVCYRDFHSLTSGHGWTPQVGAIEGGLEVSAFDGATSFSIQSATMDWQPGGDWYWDFRRDAETARGLDDREDLFAAGVFSGVLTREHDVTLGLSATESTAAFSSDESLARERERQRAIIDTATASKTSAPYQQLVLAADQFIARRELDGGEVGSTVIAGYHWFNDWGRDTMIALPGLTLATGRPEIARSILATFARYVKDGLLPNNFPDRGGEVPGYNTADATLWYVLRIHEYVQATGDEDLLGQLLPTIREIIERHIGGTRFGIGVDPNDDLLRAGQADYQLTWMDAKVGDWVVTPRIGKPVELNALWYNALRCGAIFFRQADSDFASTLEKRADRLSTSFLDRFVDSSRGWLADVVDGPDGDDWSLRPNQIFAVSLPHPLVEEDLARRVVDVVGERLLTSHGLRSLDARDSSYVGRYAGGPVQRDGSYHQGTVWSWLIGPYVTAHRRVHDDIEAIRSTIEPLLDHLRDAGLGTVSEIFDGDPPHAPAGCVAQVWSVAELLQVARMLQEKSGEEGQQAAERA